MFISDFFSKVGQYFREEPMVNARFMVEDDEGNEIELEFDGSWRDGKKTIVFRFKPYIKGSISANPV